MKSCEKSKKRQNINPKESTVKRKVLERREKWRAATQGKNQHKTKKKTDYIPQHKNNLPNS
jgi:hypothetical protein